MGIPENGARSYPPVGGGRRSKATCLLLAFREKPGDNPGLRPQDVFVNLVEAAKEN
jgi:hypothetical protein